MSRRHVIRIFQPALCKGLISAVISMCFLQEEILLEMRKFDNQSITCEASYEHLMYHQHAPAHMGRGASGHTLLTHVYDTSAFNLHYAYKYFIIYL